MNIGKYDKLLLITLLIAVIIGAMTRVDKDKKHIEKLEMFITDKNAEIYKSRNLIKEYENLVFHYVDLEKNLLRQISLLENQKIDLKQEKEELVVENESLRTIRARLTAYSPLDNVDGNQAMGDPTKTSRGKTVGRYYAAADPKKLPYGTILEIPNYGIVEIQDTGSALRKDNKNIRVDLYHDTYNQAMRFGIQRRDIKILKWGE